MSFFILILIFVMLAVVLGIIWRLLSQRHNLPCPVWLGWLVERDNPFTKVNRAHVIIEQLNIRPGMKVVDVGCGPGRLTIPLAQKVGPHGEVVALDMQPGMLAWVKDKAQKAQLQNITFTLAGIGQGALPHNYFDYALLVTVLGEIPEQKPALQEIFDALKPGGILSVTEVIFDPHFQSQNAVIQAAEPIGFKKRILPAIGSLLLCIWKNPYIHYNPIDLLVSIYMLNHYY